MYMRFVFYYKHSGCNTETISSTIEMTFTELSCVLPKPDMRFCNPHEKSIMLQTCAAHRTLGCLRVVSLAIAAGILQHKRHGFYYNYDLCVT